MTACTNDEESSIISSLPIQFSAGITSTRVSGDAWDVNDKIGISMVGNEITAIENVPYVLHTLNGQFQAESNALQFP
ncbi:fimbrillin family protein, partial [uncultured Bacteroides sp.]|uniref:fimbrillin family protein n=1 Tax=uncultured Bacteroides sp. TaxID=162156 RepID=UPI00261DE869